MNYMVTKQIYLGIFITTLLTYSWAGAQENEILPYETIPEYPESFTPGTVVSRMIDGLGFRYYWATEGLTEKDLSYKPSPTNRTIGETLDHIYGLSQVIYNSAIKRPNKPETRPETPEDFAELRKQTLLNFKRASEHFLTTDKLEDHMVEFVRNGQATSFPFWNQINGPIEDAVWHSGQVVALRRASGNPIDPNVSVFRGIRAKK